MRRPLVNKLVMMQRDIQRELDEAKHYGGPKALDQDTADEMTAKLEGISKKLAKWVVCTNVLDAVVSVLAVCVSMHRPCSRIHVSAFTQWSGVKEHLPCMSPCKGIAGQLDSREWH